MPDPTPAASVPAPVSSTARRSAIRSLLWDSGILLTLLFLLNWVLAAGDPGWRTLNPTPWLLLPFFLGARYSLGAGVSGAVAAGVGVAALQYLEKRSGLALVQLVGENPYYFLGLLAAAATGGLAHFLAVGAQLKLRQERDELMEEHRQLLSDLALHRENEIVLQEALLLHGAEVSSLTEEMHRLFSQDCEDWLAAFLASLHRSAGVAQAAIYLPRQDAWSRHAKVGDGTGLPETLTGNTDPILVEAVRQGVTVSCRNVWSADEESGERSDWLAAVPWKPEPAAPVAAVLALRRMDLDHLHWDQLARIEAAFGWVMAHAEIAALRQQPAHAELERPDNLLDILEPREFAHRIQLALDAARTLDLPSQLITFRPREGCTEETWLSLREALRSTLRPVDSLGLLPGETANAVSLGLLLPAASDAGAAARLERFFSRFPRLEPLVEASHQPVSDPALFSGLLSAV